VISRAEARPQGKAFFGVEPKTDFARKGAKTQRGSREENRRILVHPQILCIEEGQAMN
jgi:hypothetical protein